MSVTKEDACGAALECGFMISTAYGQDSKKFMPVSDSDTIFRFAIEIEKKERERIAKVFDGMGLRPYSEIVRDSNLTKGDTK